MKKRKTKLQHEVAETTTSKKEDASILHLYISKHMFLIALTVRLSSLLIVRTFFVPDEYWQSTEVAHWNVYKYGYITWEWKEKIRSYLYPCIFEIYFLCLNLLRLDYPVFVINGPHFLQAVLTAVADVSMYRLVLKIFNSTHTASYAFTLQLIAWFLFYTCSRTLSNTAEMCFISIGLSYFPFRDNTHNESYICNNLFLSLLFAGISFIIRPTSMIIWTPIIFVYIFLKKKVFFIDLIFSGVKVLPILLFLSFGVDYYFYKEFVFTHWNFLKFNIFQNIGIFYGTHSYYWYFLEALPVVFTFDLVFVLLGVYRSTGKQCLLFLIALLYIFVHRYVEIYYQKNLCVEYCICRPVQYISTQGSRSWLQHKRS